MAEAVKPTAGPEGGPGEPATGGHGPIATDAAGEGLNLQAAHLMVNYDLPWNPNRLEQRFGRIHRIGQDEVCHLWNLVATDTREGAVYERLLTKMEAQRVPPSVQVRGAPGRQSLSGNWYRRARTHRGVRVRSLWSAKKSVYEETVLWA